MRNARHAAAMLVATMLLGGCAFPRYGTGVSGDPVSTLIQASLIAVDGAIAPGQPGPLCDPQDPSPPAMCPPAKDETPR